MEEYRITGKEDHWVIQKLIPEHIADRGRGRGKGNLIPAKWIDDCYPGRLNLVPVTLLELTVEFKPTSNLDDILESVKQAEKQILNNLEERVKNG